MAINKKYLGIRFPFTSIDAEGFFIDLDYSPHKEIKSDIIHLLFTPKGQRFMMPDFGTRLLEFIFEPKDDITMVDIKIEIEEAIKKFIPGVKMTDLKVSESDNEDYTANVELKYIIDEGNIKTKDIININI
jgi:phage baseplate assembly protein W